jgi:histidine triad (HIT) family protein
MLTKEQTTDIKNQLLKQIDSSNMQNKDQIKTSIESMDQEQFEEFLKQNKLLKDQDKCVFCSIIDKEIPSYILTENSDAIAVLEINPISKGHTIIIPKIHSEAISKSAMNLAEEFSKKISKLFNPKKIDLVNSNLFGHEIINLIPVYKDENIHSKRKQSKPEELEELTKEIKKVPETEKEKPTKEKVTSKKETITDKNTWLPKRTP